MKNLILILFLSLSSYGFSQQLVYTPINPSFGGDPFNYTWLLNSANAQNSFEDPNSILSGFAGFESLNQSLNNQMLLQQFGGETPPLGTSSSGNFEYDVFESTQGLVINILNIKTGEQTQIIIPN